MLSTLQNIAKGKNKIPALTEFGFGTLSDSTLWTKVFWNAVKNHNISYVLGWRNAGHNGSNYEFYMPYKEHAGIARKTKMYCEKWRMLF